MIKQIIDLLATLTLLSDIFIGLAIIYLLLRRWYPIGVIEKSGKFLQEHALVFAFIVALTATCGSLFLSEIANLTPCKLCWFQRIFMYPQAVILAVALYYQDWNVKKYILPLSVIGAGFSLYNYYIQLFPPVIAVCSINNAESCSAKIIMAYGYVTFATMALTASLLMIFFLSLRHQSAITSTSFEKLE